MGERDATDLEEARARALASLELLRAEQEIDAGEYERRVALARRARSAGELQPLAWPSEPAARLGAGSPDEADERGSVVAILSGSTRRGVWEPPRRLRVLSVLGGVDLDFRRAEFLDGVTEVEIVAVLGGVNVVVPPGVDVASGGLGLLGEFTHLVHRSPHPDSPALRLRGVALLGGVNVKVKS